MILTPGEGAGVRMNMTQDTSAHIIQKGVTVDTDTVVINGTEYVKKQNDAPIKISVLQRP